LRGHELCTRAELLRDETDHPRAREEYFKIQIGPLEPLPQPIKSEKWHRITFFYTTGEYLLRARTINDLIIQTDERQILWQSLRERACREQTYVPSSFPEGQLDPAILALLMGFKDLGKE
jgi:hypothetical protein